MSRSSRRRGTAALLMLLACFLRDEPPLLRCHGLTVLLPRLKAQRWSSSALSARQGRRQDKRSFSRNDDDKQWDEDDLDYSFFDDDEDDDEEFPHYRSRDTAGASARRQPSQHALQKPYSAAAEDLTTTTTSSHFFSRKSLNDASFGKSRNFLRLCQAAGIVRPSKIQSLAWPVLLNSNQAKHAIVADQTGSGKTLAYLLPLLHRMLEAPRASTATATPRILILSPTAELADQTRAVCDALAAAAGQKFKTRVLTAHGHYATSIRDQIRLLQRTDVDVLISTPGRLSTILRTRQAGLDLSQLLAVVLDEVDVLLVEDTFGPQLRTVGAAVAEGAAAAASSPQFVFVTATLPNAVVQQVQAEFPEGVVQIRGPGLHRVAPTVHETLIDVSVPPRRFRDAQYCFDVKAEHLLATLRETRCRRTIVFCNTVETCRKVENLLQRHDRRGQLWRVLPYHNALDPAVRNANLQQFSRNDKPNKQKKKKVAALVDAILVCTDRAARGVDFEAAPVDSVILFDFPKDPADYVRRVGRTARAGRTGTSTVLAFGWQLPIARQVMGQSASSLLAEDGQAAFASDDEDEEESAEQWRRRNSKKKRQRGKTTNMVKDSIEQKRMWGR